MEADAVPFQADMLGGGNVEIREILAFPVTVLWAFTFLSGSGLAVRTVWIIGTNGNGRPPFSLFQRLKFDGKVAILEAQFRPAFLNLSVIIDCTPFLQSTGIADFQP